MKRILLALTMIGFLLPFAPRAQAQTEVSLNFFYDNLTPYGTWLDVADYGYCFQPNVAVNNSSWRPYADGYWAYTDAGWTWVSYEDFGWATYHYGRWSHLVDYGWVWVPGYEWGPAWVSWRTGGDYIGWAPLPASAERVYEGRAITGQVDIEFDIGPQYYNFIDIRYIGEPVLRDRIFEPQRNVTIINSTVNVTNITYSNSTVYNYGPDYNRLNQYSTRPIQRLTLQRQAQASAEVAGQGAGRANFNRVNGNQLLVVAPKIQRTEQQIAPKQVKAKVAQPKIERGWQGVADRAKLQQQMKSENAQNVPAPSFQPQQGRKQEAVAGNQPATSSGAAQANERAGAAQQRAGQSPAAPNEEQAGKAPRKGLRNAPVSEQASPAAEQANQPGAAAGERTQGQGKKRNARAEKTPTGQEQPSPHAEQMQPERSVKPQQTNEQGAQQAEQAQGQQSERTDRAKMRHAERAPRAEEAPQNQEPQRAERPVRPEQAQPSQERERPARSERPQEPRKTEQTPQAERPQPPEQARRPEQAQPPRGAAAPERPAGEQQGKGKKKKPAEAPSPTP